MSEVEPAERRARVVLSQLCEPGDPDACRLVSEFSAHELLVRIRATPGEAPSRLRDWQERLPGADYSRLMAKADAVDSRYVCPGDGEWPAALDSLAALQRGPTDRRGGQPFGLWVRGGGDLAALTVRSVAVVGSRAASAYGERVAGQLGFDLAADGVTPVSGGAYGIDVAAHRGALSRARPTVAVLAGGIDHLYPSGNAVVLRAMAKDGVLVSEAAPGAAARKSRFLVRNRLIAALTLGTVVVEAALRSGSLNTARWAFDLSRPVMGVPGPVTSATSAGVHELLRQPETLLVTDAAEIVEHVSSIGAGLAPRKSGPRIAADGLSVQARRILEAVPVLAVASVDDIARAADVTRSAVAGLLDQLAEMDLVVRTEGGWRLARPC